MNPKQKKAFKFSALIVGAFILLSMGGLLPFISTGPSANLVYLPEWAQIDCVRVSEDDRFVKELAFQ